MWNHPIFCWIAKATLNCAISGSRGSWSIRSPKRETRAAGHIWPRNGSIRLEPALGITFDRTFGAWALLWYGDHWQIDWLEIYKKKSQIFANNHKIFQFKIIATACHNSLQLKFKKIVHSAIRRRRILGGGEFAIATIICNLQWHRGIHTVTRSQQDSVVEFWVKVKVFKVEISTGKFPYPSWNSVFDQLQEVVNGDPPILTQTRDNRFSNDLMVFVNSWYVCLAFSCVDLGEAAAAAPPKRLPQWARGDGGGAHSKSGQNCTGCSPILGRRGQSRCLVKS